MQYSLLSMSENTCSGDILKNFLYMLFRPLTVTYMRRLAFRSTFLSSYHYFCQNIRQPTNCQKCYIRCWRYVAILQGVHLMQILSTFRDCPQILSKLNFQIVFLSKFFCQQFLHNHLLVLFSLITVTSHNP